MFKLKLIRSDFVKLLLFGFIALASGTVTQKNHFNYNTDAIGNNLVSRFKLFKRSVAANETSTKLESKLGSIFDNFKQIEDDLEVPSQMPGRVEFFALPPAPSIEGRSCPQCKELTPNIFEKLFCSSQLAVRVKFKGFHAMTILQELTPNQQFAKLHKLVAFTMKHHCICENLAPGFEAVLLVTPPRTFSVRSVQLLHLDDSIALIPWDIASNVLNTQLNCTSALISNDVS